jgi:hypothetical protein
MGLSESQEVALFEGDYIKESRTGHAYFGTHAFLVNRTQKEMLICRQLPFRSSAEHRQFL